MTSGCAASSCSSCSGWRNSAGTSTLLPQYSQRIEFEPSSGTAREAPQAGQWKVWADAFDDRLGMVKSSEIKSLLAIKVGNQLYPRFISPIISPIDRHGLTQPWTSCRQIWTISSAEGSTVFSNAPLAGIGWFIEAIRRAARRRGPKVSTARETSSAPHPRSCVPSSTVTRLPVLDTKPTVCPARRAPAVLERPARRKFRTRKPAAASPGAQARPCNRMRLSVRVAGGAPRTLSR